LWRELATIGPRARAANQLSNAYAWQIAALAANNFWSTVVNEMRRRRTRDCGYSNDYYCQAIKLIQGGQHVANTYRCVEI